MGRFAFSSAALRKMKALVIIAMLAVTEGRRAQAMGKLGDAFKSQGDVDNHGGVDSRTSKALGSDMAAHRQMDSHFGPPLVMDAFLNDPAFKEQLVALAGHMDAFVLSMKKAPERLLTQARSMADEMFRLSSGSHSFADSSLPEAMAAMIADKDFQQRARVIAEEIKQDVKIYSHGDLEAAKAALSSQQTSRLALEKTDGADTTHESLLEEWSGRQDSSKPHGIKSLLAALMSLVGEGSAFQVGGFAGGARVATAGQLKTEPAFGGHTVGKRLDHAIQMYYLGETHWDDLVEASQAEQQPPKDIAAATSARGIRAVLPALMDALHRWGFDTKMAVKDEGGNVKTGFPVDFPLRLCVALWLFGDLYSNSSNKVALVVAGSATAVVGLGGALLYSIIDRLVDTSRQNKLLRKARIVTRARAGARALAHARARARAPARAPALAQPVA